MPNDPTPKLRESLLKAKVPEGYHRAFGEVLAAADAFFEEGRKQYSVTLACRAGCAFCCYYRVDATAPEVFAIGHYIRTHSTPDRVKLVLDRLTAHVQRIRGLTPEQHVNQNVECPLLQDSQCSIYTVRPFACRRHHSQAVQPCEDTYNHPTDLTRRVPTSPELYAGITAAHLSIRKVYENLGFYMTAFELGSALREALTSPSSWKRWRDRKKPFLEAAAPFTGGKAM